MAFESSSLILPVRGVVFPRDRGAVKLLFDDSDGSPWTGAVDLAGDKAPSLVSLFLDSDVKIHVSLSLQADGLPGTYSLNQRGTACWFEADGGVVPQRGTASRSSTGERGGREGGIYPRRRRYS